MLVGILIMFTKKMQLLLTTRLTILSSPTLVILNSIPIVYTYILKYADCKLGHELAYLSTSALFSLNLKSALVHIFITLLLSFIHLFLYYYNMEKSIRVPMCIYYGTIEDLRYFYSAINLS